MIALTRRVRFARALGSRPFALLWAGQTISSIGDGAFYTAMAWQVLLLTGSGTAMGIVLAAQTAPLVVFMLLGGVVADRLPRRLTLLWSDGGRAVVTLAVAALGLSGHLQYWELVALAALFGFAEAFFRPAYQAIPPDMVPAEDLSSANALGSFSRTISTLVGPAIGAALVSVSSPSLAFAFDGLTFVASVVCLVAMGPIRRPAATAVGEKPLPQERLEASEPPMEGAVVVMADGEAPTPRAKGPRGVLADIREGIGYVTGSPWLWITIAIASLGNVGFAPLQVSLPKLIHDQYHQGVWLLGAVLAATSVGSMLAALVVGQMKRIRHRGLVAYGTTVLSSVAIALFGLPLSSAVAPAVALGLGALFGMGVGVFEVIWISTLQELVPADKLGRVSSVDWMGSLCLQPVGLALVGALTDRLGPGLIFAIGGGLNVALTLLGLMSRGVRSLD